MISSALLFFTLFQDDIRNVLKEGRLLLSNLETVKASKRDVEEERDIRADMETVQRCRVQTPSVEKLIENKTVFLK